MTDTTPNPDPQPTPNPEPDPKPDKIEFTPEQNDWISRKIAYELKSAQEKRDAADAEARKKAEAEAERKKQEAAGQFEDVRKSLETERDAAVIDRDSLKATNEALTAYFDTQYTAALKDLPDVIKAFAPAEDAPFATKADWLTKAQEQASKIDTSGTPGNRPNPTPATGHFDLKSAVEEAKARGSYRV